MARHLLIRMDSKKLIQTRKHLAIGIEKDLLIPKLMATKTRSVIRTKIPIPKERHLAIEIMMDSKKLKLMAKPKPMLSDLAKPNLKLMGIGILKRKPIRLARRKDFARVMATLIRKGMATMKPILMDFGIAIPKVKPKGFVMLMGFGTKTDFGTPIPKVKEILICLGFGKPKDFVIGMGILIPKVMDSGTLIRKHSKTDSWTLKQMAILNRKHSDFEIEMAREIRMMTDLHLPTLSGIQPYSKLRMMLFRC